MSNTKSIKNLDEATPRDLTNIEKPAVSVSVLIFSINKGKLEIILIQRVREPFKDYFSIPGDIIDIDESLESAARRVLHDKTGLSDVYLEQLYTFSDPARDPRGRVITVGYFAFLPHNSVDLSKAPNALHACFMPVNKLPKLAFDHKKIIEYAVDRIKAKVEYSDIAKGLLSEKFRLYELQKVHEIILGEELDKRNFRKKILSLGLIKQTGEVYRQGNYRPAQLYKFVTKDVVLFD
jgi:8-oxo-dGTP diphosphatase